MSYSPALPRATDPSTDSLHAAWLRARWPRVHVDLVEEVPARHGRLVRAVVQLGDLTPADVQVDLLASPAGGEPTADGRRMWSSRSYDNGRFVFEATIVADAPFDGAHVRVRPRTGDGPSAEGDASPGRAAAP